MGGSTSSPATLPSQAAVRDLLCFSLVVPLAYLLPDMMLLNLLGDTLNSVHASFALPSFIYFHLSCNHRAATSSLVGLFLGSRTIMAELEWGSNFFSNFCLTSSAVEAGLGSCTGLKYLLGMLIWTSGLTAALRTRLNIWGSVIFPRAEMLAATMLAWPMASDMWSNMLMIS